MIRNGSPTYGCVCTVCQLLVNKNKREAEARGDYNFCQIYAHSDETRRVTSIMYADLAILKAQGKPKPY